MDRQHLITLLNSVADPSPQTLNRLGTFDVENVLAVLDGLDDQTIRFVLWRAVDAHERREKGLVELAVSMGYTSAKTKLIGFETLSRRDVAPVAIYVSSALSAAICPDYYRTLEEDFKEDLTDFIEWQRQQAHKGLTVGRARQELMERKQKERAQAKAKKIQEAKQDNGKTTTTKNKAVGRTRALSYTNSTEVNGVALTGMAASIARQVKGRAKVRTSSIRGEH